MCLYRIEMPGLTAFLDEVALETAKGTLASFTLHGAGAEE